MKMNISSKILTLASALLLLIVMSSCEDEELVSYEEGDYTQIANPYVQVQTPVISFQAGTPEYEVAFNAINGTKGLKEVRLYSTFTDAASGKTSDEVLLETYKVTDPVIERISDTFTYEELRAGLKVDGNALPASDLDVAIGSGWNIRFEATFEDGTTGDLPGSIKVGVLHRFAGLYRVIESSYFRIGEDQDGWNGSNRFIGSVDEETFSYNDYWGPFGWTGNAFHFDVDFENGNAITGPILVDGLFSGTALLTCADDAGSFVNVECAGSNVVVEDEATGKHKIYLTYGYYTASGDENEGAREFYEVLEKVVD